MVWYDPRHNGLANQDATRVRTWIKGPPEQETDTTKANTRAYDKWAQGGTHGPKGKVGGSTGRPADLPGRSTRVVGRLPGGPTDLPFWSVGYILGPLVIGTGIGFYHVGFLL